MRKNNNGKVLDMSCQYHRAKAVLRKIKCQFPQDGALFYAVFERSVLDLFLDKERCAAVDYLHGPMWHVGMCGLDADWIRKELKAAGVCCSSMCKKSAKDHMSGDCELAYKDAPSEFRSSAAVVSKQTVLEAIETLKATDYPPDGDLFKSLIGNRTKWEAEKTKNLAKLRARLVELQGA